MATDEKNTPPADPLDVVELERLLTEAPEWNGAAFYRAFGHEGDIAARILAVFPSLLAEVRRLRAEKKERAPLPHEKCSCGHSNWIHTPDGCKAGQGCGGACDCGRFKQAFLVDERDAAIRDRDSARAEVERLRGALETERAKQVRILATTLLDRADLLAGAAEKYAGVYEEAMRIAFDEIGDALAKLEIERAPLEEALRTIAKIRARVLSSATPAEGNAEVTR